MTIGNNTTIGAGSVVTKDIPDNVFASVCYCPIIDLEHADMAYEWLFKDTDSRQGLPEEQKALSAALAAPINGGMPGGDRPMMRMGGGRVGEYITGLDMPTYLNYVVSTQPLKCVPAFDSKDVLGGRASGENDEFGDAAGSSVNFTEYAASLTGSALSNELKKRVFLMNPMNSLPG